MKKPCIKCGTITDNNYCEPCKPPQRSGTHHNRPPHKNKRNTTRWKRLSKHIRNTQPWCTACGTETDLTVDHIQPISKAPHREYDLTNLQVLCRTCNSHKGTKPEPQGDTP